MKNQNNEADLVNDLSEVLNELKEIKERSGDCDLWRTSAWNGHGGDFVCMERCGGVTIQEAAKWSYDKSGGHKANAWFVFSHGWVWTKPENLKCKENWLGEQVYMKMEPSCDPSVNDCMWD